MPTIGAEDAAITSKVPEGAWRRPARMRPWRIAPWVLAAMFWQAPAASAETLFDSLRGSWSGSGQIQYKDGKSESLECTAYYTGEAAQLRLAIRCEAGSNKVEIRGQLAAQGQTLSGTWEERTFNAAGKASGSLAANKMSLAISGGGFHGSMSVSAAGGKQAVKIATEGIDMKSVTITLGKS